MMLIRLILGNYAGEYGKNVMSPLKQDTIKVTIDE